MEEEDIDTRDFTYFSGLSMPRIFFWGELNFDFLSREGLYPFVVNTCSKDGFNILPPEVCIGVFDSLAANKENLFILSIFAIFLTILLLGVMFLNLDSGVLIKFFGVLTLNLDFGVAISSSWCTRGENCDSLGDENFLFAFCPIFDALLSGELPFSENLEGLFLLSIMSWIRLLLGFFTFKRWPLPFVFNGLSRDSLVIWSFVSVTTTTF